MSKQFLVIPKWDLVHASNCKQLLVIPRWSVIVRNGVAGGGIMSTTCLSCRLLLTSPTFCSEYPYLPHLLLATQVGVLEFLHDLFN